MADQIADYIFHYKYNLYYVMLTLQLTLYTTMELFIFRPINIQFFLNHSFVFCWQEIAYSQVK